MEALVLDAKRKTAAVQTVPVPEPGPEDVLIKVEAVALNPVDSLYTAHPLGATGRVVGSDFAGTIISVPTLASEDNLKVGDRVAGFLQGACSVNDRPGAFAEYLVCPWDLVWKIPNDTTFQQAAAISLCGLTAAQAIFFRLGLPSPFSDKSPEEDSIGKGSIEAAERTFFIYGASTSVAMYAAQLIRRSVDVHGYKIRLLGAASRSRWALLQSEPYSYDFLVDYHDANWPDQVRKAAGGAVDYAYDCISEGQTVATISHLLQQRGAMAIVRSRAAGAWSSNGLTSDVEPIYGAVWEGLGEEVQYQGFTVLATPECRAFAVAFYQWLSKAGKLQANPIRLMPGGLQNVVNDGFALLGTGKVAERQLQRIEDWMSPVGAEKLVYTITGPTNQKLSVAE